MNRSSLLSLIGTTVLASGLGITAICGGFNKDSALSSFFEKDYLTLLTNKPITDEILKELPVLNLIKAENIAQKFSRLPCSRYLFRDLKWKKKESKSTDLRLNVPQSGPKYLKFKSKKVFGCLNVWWEKEVFSNQKWNGRWNLIWAISDENKGILLSSTATAENGKLKIDGQGYTLRKEGGKWETISYQATKEQEVNDENRGYLIIKAGNSIEKKEGALWGFKFETKNICSSTDECKQGTKTYSKKSWKFLNKKKLDGKLYELKEWSSNFGAWSKNQNKSALFSTNHMDMYKGTKGYFQLIASSSV